MKIMNSLGPKPVPLKSSKPAQDHSGRVYVDRFDTQRVVGITTLMGVVTAAEIAAFHHPDVFQAGTMLAAVGAGMMAGGSVGLMAGRVLTKALGCDPKHSSLDFDMMAGGAVLGSIASLCLLGQPTILTGVALAGAGMVVGRAIANARPGYSYQTLD